jgi:hypothetical protein
LKKVFKFNKNLKENFLAKVMFYVKFFFIQKIKNMDETKKRKFFETDKNMDTTIDSKIQIEFQRRKECHYNILGSNNYAKIIKNF